MSADRSGLRHHKSSSSTGQASGKLENYTVGKAIGQGAYAIVHQCQHKQTMKKYAIKIYQKAKLNDSMKRKAVQREILALRKIDHPNIIKMHDLIETSREICIVTDYIRGISLHQFVKQQCTNRQVKEPTCRRFFKQITEAFDYLHHKGIAHRDVKLDNILIEDSTNMIKIIDFGFAAFCNDSQKHKIFCGTPSYMAPELVRKHEYDGREVDMWALGVLLYALLAGTFPFRGQNEKDLYSKIMRANFKFPEMMSRDARQIIQKLICVDSRKRYKASDLIREPWIKCKDLPLSIYETAGGLFRASSVDHRSSSLPSSSKHPMKADSFNRNLSKLHLDAVENLKSMGFTSKAIEDSMKTHSNAPGSFAMGIVQHNQIYKAYQEHIDNHITALASFE